jgi:hypothetical protein
MGSATSHIASPCALLARSYTESMLLTFAAVAYLAETQGIILASFLNHLVHLRGSNVFGNSAT